jgi:signal transduction histidine kinase
MPPQSVTPNRDQTGEQTAQLAAANVVLQRSLERLANLSDVRLLVSEVLTSVIEVAGAAGGALLRYDPAAHTLLLQSYVLDGLILDISNNARLAQKKEMMRAEDFPHWNDILSATDTFFSYNDCGVHPALPEIVYSQVTMNSAGLALRRGDTVLGLLVLVYHPTDEIPAERLVATRTLTRYAALVLELAWLADESREAAIARAQSKADEDRTAAVAEERNRMAREIHDTLAQSLALIVMQLQRAESKLGSAWESAREPLENVRQMAVEGLAEARRSVSMLRPAITPRGLVQAVHDAADVVRGYYGGALEVRVSGEAHSIDRSVEEELFAILREALTNAVKHSKASRIEVQVAYPDDRSVRVSVSDDGIGFDPDHLRNGHYGLIGMSERAERIDAALTLASEPGAGTEIVAVWPNG